MKKTLAMVLCLSLLLAGCGAGEQPEAADLLMETELH